VIGGGLTELINWLARFRLGTILARNLVYTAGDMETTSPSIIRFGAFEADLSSGELRKFGTRIKLQDRPFQILAILLEQPGQTITREQLQSRLWPADTFVDFEHGLNTAINKLRQALSDDPDNPRFVETLPKRGYRFIAPVSKANGVASTVAQNAATSPDAPIGTVTASRVTARGRSAFLRRRLFSAIVGILVLAVISVGTRYFLRPKSVPAWSEIRIAPLNGLPHESDAAFSPDGAQVAFVWSGGTQDRAHIYVSQIGAESPRRLSNSSWAELAPVWSPDGKHIAFMRFAIDESLDGIYIASAVGGSERKVYSLSPKSTTTDLDWSPDGKDLAFGERASTGEARRIYLLSLDTLEKHAITSPLEGILGDSDPVFSPDGQKVAFLRDRLDTQEIFVVPVQGGTPRQVTFDSRLIQGVSWNADGSALIYSSNRGGLPSLWRIPVSGGTPEPLPFGSGGRAIRPVVARQGNRMAYTNMMYSSAIWRAELPVAGSKPAPAAKFIVSTELEEGPAYSPDGRHIAFQSTRTGNYEIWRCDADGSNLVQLTHFKGPLTGTPRWSPDSRELVFDSRPGGHSEIFVIKAEGGEPRQLTSGESENGVADWSADGQWIYFGSSRGGTWEIWKLSAQGGTPVQITHQGGFAPEASRDAKFIYYAKGRELPGVWRVPVDGGEETKILDGPPATGWGYFFVTGNGIYYGDESSHKNVGLSFYDFKTRRSSVVLSLDPFGSGGAPGLSISPDGRYALYTALAPITVNIMLVENFRY
jgi:Tol biopolymer transport system component/DNA-binding winged helix-turn-helix (wHTH) protein